MTKEGDGADHPVVELEDELNASGREWKTILIWGVICVVGACSVMAFQQRREGRNCPTQPVGYSWVKDVKLNDSSDKLSLYSGQHTFVGASEVCQTIGGKLLTVGLDKKVESTIDEVIADNFKAVFINTGGTHLMWTTGWYNLTSLQWNQKFFYDRFCYNSSEFIQNMPNRTGLLHIVKKYEGRMDLVGNKLKSCWQLYHQEDLLDINFACQADQTFSFHGSLPFSAESIVHGLDAFQEDFEKVNVSDLPNATYYFHVAPCPFDVANRHCQKLGAELLYIQSKSEEEILDHFISSNVTQQRLFGSKVRQVNGIRSMWTAGYYDLLDSKDPYKLRWENDVSNSSYVNFCPGMNRKALEVQRQKLLKLNSTTCSPAGRLRITRKYRLDTGEKSCMQLTELDLRNPPLPAAIRHFVCKKIRGR